MSERILGVGVLGFGFMGRMHTYAYRTIPLHYDPAPGRFALRAVCTAHAATAEAAKQAGGFDRCTTDPRAVIEADDVDIVHVCTPNQAHLDALRLAVAAGRHIYVDKPVTASLAEADALAGLLPGYRGVAQVALQNRFLPATMKAKRLVDEGFIGPVSHFRAAYLHGGSIDPDKAVNWKSTAAAGGGVIRDLGSHVLDLLDWLIGPFAAVHCASRIWSRQRPSLDRPGERMTIDVEDAAVMLLRSADGAIGSVEASKIATGSEDELRFEIHGRHGAMRFNLMQPNYLEVFDGRLPDGDLGGRHGWQQIACVQRYPVPDGGRLKLPSPKNAIGWTRAHVHAIYCFLRSVAGAGPASPSLSDGLRLQRVLEAVRESAGRGAWVDLPQR
ncbi:MAG: Inositol 2-dehydrogenase/D-chiro-inositol 3-dehydrogenase [Phycisphaerae bacterium]|nr:Inositol 2-dehydrogenase/D-chiro-inositol 3-dehydrogenase [Phycisphaerae bacterium]